MPDELFPRFARVPEGEFVMGADDGDEDERPAHTASVDAFHLSVFPITNQQYAEFVHASGHPVPAVRELPLMVTPAHEPTFRELAAPYIWHGGEMPRDRWRHPVTLVTYSDAVAYCEWLASELALPVRLATEAEWERAARGELEGRKYPWGDEIDPSRANFLLDPALKRFRGTRPVGSYAPNAFGLHDMTGNVWEWVADWYGPEVYRARDRRNPKGPLEGTLRIVRGGSWVTHDLAHLRCSHRHKVPEDTYAYSIGFRVAYSDPADV
jgi:formylglycine-generating enzyme required for sulfatase activity